MGLGIGGGRKGFSKGRQAELGWRWGGRRAECECSAGYYSEKPGGECLLCVMGAVCNGGGALPTPRHGYWGQKQCKQYGGDLECGGRWAEFHQCQFPTMCPNKEPFLCDHGLTGRLCTREQRGWFKVGGVFHFQCGRLGWLLNTMLILLVVLGWYAINKVVSTHYDALDIALLFVQCIGMIRCPFLAVSPAACTVAPCFATFHASLVSCIEWAPHSGEERAHFARSG